MLVAALVVNFQKVKLSIYSKLLSKSPFCHEKSFFQAPCLVFSDQPFIVRLFKHNYCTQGSCVACVCVRVCFLRSGMIYTTPHSINSSMTAQTCLCVHTLLWGIRLTEAHRQNSVDSLIDRGLTLTSLKHTQIETLTLKLNIHVYFSHWFYLFNPVKWAQTQTEVQEIC